MDVQPEAIVRSGSGAMASDWPAAVLVEVAVLDGGGDGGVPVGVVVDVRRRDGGPMVVPADEHGEVDYRPEHRGSHGGARGEMLAWSASCSTPSRGCRRWNAVSHRWTSCPF